MKLKTLIVDDEPLARERLRGFLARDPLIELAGEAGNGSEAVKAIRGGPLDLVFLDIEMPEMDGFAVLEAVKDCLPRAVVFVTAYDQFAVKAFEVHAVDYLLKPFDEDRLGEAVRRVRHRLDQVKGPTFGERMEAVLAQLRPRTTAPDRLLIKTDGKMVVVLIDHIDWVESADNYVVVRVGKEKHIQRETLSSMEGKLPADTFVRISRSHIVNIKRVKELQPLFHGEYSVILTDGSRLTLTRTYREILPRFGLS